jgi:hypothetical protein
LDYNNLAISSELQLIGPHRNPIKKGFYGVQPLF